jgi:tripartite-type tricarboxylate transporter receptor subunit TctC
MSRLLRWCAVLVTGLVLAGPALAQDNPLRVVLGFPPGAGADTLTRLLSDRMRASLNRPVVVENKTGAGGILANEIVKNARPDGSMILLTPFATMVAYPHSYSKLSYDPFTDYLPVAHVASFQLAFGVGEKVPAKTVAEYVALAKGSKDYTNYASASAGSLPHFFGVMFARAAGLELTHVPYRGTAPVLQALVGGEIPAAVLVLADIGGLAQAGKARVLAVSGGRRAPGFPDVPTFKESGYDIEGTAWYAVFAPAGTPPDIVQRLSTAAIDAVQAPDIKSRLETMGLEPTGFGPDRLSAILKADYERWGPVIRASGFKAD